MDSKTSLLFVLWRWHQTLRNKGPCPFWGRGFVNCILFLSKIYLIIVECSLLIYFCNIFHMDMFMKYCPGPAEQVTERKSVGFVSVSS